MCPSDKRLEANRLNAQKSTGPKTPEGKRRSSLNALRHGVTGRILLLTTEEQTAYQKFADALATSLGATTPLELHFAHQIADAHYRLNRIRTVEDAMLALAHFEPAGDIDVDHPEIHTALTAGSAFRNDSQSFVNLSLYEQRLNASLKNALKQLRDLQEERRQKHENDMANAVRLYKFDVMENRSPNPPSDGFVFSTPEVAEKARQTRRANQARVAENIQFNPKTWRESFFGSAPKDYAA